MQFDSNVALPLSTRHFYHLHQGSYPPPFSALVWWPTISAHHTKQGCSTPLRYPYPKTLRMGGKLTYEVIIKSPQTDYSCNCQNLF